MRHYHDRPIKHPNRKNVAWNPKLQGPYRVPVKNQTLWSSLDEDMTVAHLLEAGALWSPFPNVCIVQMDVYWCDVLQVCVSGPSIFNGGGNDWLKSPERRKLYSAESCPSGTQKYTVKRGDFCPQIISKYGGGSVAKFQNNNKGFVCTNNKLYNGQILCTLKGWGNVEACDMSLSSCTSHLYSNLSFMP